MGIMDHVLSLVLISVFIGTEANKDGPVFTLPAGPFANYFGVGQCQMKWGKLASGRAEWIKDKCCFKNCNVGKFGSRNPLKNYWFNDDYEENDNRQRTGRCRCCTVTQVQENGNVFWPTSSSAYVCSAWKDGQKCPDMNKDYLGNDLSGHTPTIEASWQNCGKKCQNTAGCKYWTWTPPGSAYPKWCHLKTAKSTVNNFDKAVSGAKGCN